MFGKSKLAITLLLSMLALPSLAIAQSISTPEQQLRAELMMLSQSGPEGALTVAKIFAKCHGSQKALNQHLTRKVIIRLPDINFASKVHQQALSAGHAAFFLSVSRMDQPEAYTNQISENAYSLWKTKLDASDDQITDDVWQNLSMCSQIAPLSDYYLDQVKIKETQK